MKVFLELDRGPVSGVGRRFELCPNVCRAIGRFDDAHGQTQDTLIVGEAQGLDAEDLALVEAHLERRRRQGPAGTGAPRNGAFKRGADILIEDELTSRTHAMVFLDAEGPSLVDLGSTNGTFVNARPVTDADLVDGDVIHIGRARFIVRVEPARR